MATCARIFVTLALLLVVAQAVPFPNPKARTRRMQPEVVQVVPLEEEDRTSVESVGEDSGAVEPEDDYPNFPVSFPFGRLWPTRPLFNFNIDPAPLFRPFTDVLRRLEQEMDGIWRNIRERNTTATGLGENVDINKLPANYSNSTFTTKVVNGQVMTVNETIHKSTTNGSQSFFRFQVINMKPKVPEQNPPEDSEAAPPSRTPEDVDAQIPVLLGGSSVLVERSHPLSLPVAAYPPASENEIEDNGAEEIKVERPIDLSNDIRVNQLLADEANKGKLYLVEPDAELVDVVDAGDGSGSRVRPRPRPFFSQMAIPISRMEFQDDDQ